MHRILLAEDHALLRDGLRLLLSSEPDFQIVAETGDGAAVENLIETHQPHLLVLDLGLPGRSGIDIARQIKARFDAVKILVLTGDAKPDSVRRALAAGADGYILKVNDNSEIIPAIRAVLGGRSYVGQRIASSFQQSRMPPATEATRVTPREHEILQFIADGHGNQEIANTLCISLDTVRTHRKNVMEKLDLHNAAEITAYVINTRMAARN